MLKRVLLSATSLLAVGLGLVLIDQGWKGRNFAWAQEGPLFEEDDDFEPKHKREKDHKHGPKEKKKHFEKHDGFSLFECEKKGGPRRGGPHDHEPGPPPGPGPMGELGRDYMMLRRAKATVASTQGAETTREWVERATELYRRGVEAYQMRDLLAAHEYGVAAHDVLRAVEHTQASRFMGAGDSSLPKPPVPDAERIGDHVEHELNRAYRRLQDRSTAEAPDGRYYLDQARKTYNAARHSAEEGKLETAAELARAAEALTHVPDHLDRLAERSRDRSRAEATHRQDGPNRPDRPRLSLPPALPE